MHMTNSVKLVATAAAVVFIGVIGVTLLPGLAQSGATAAPALASPSATTNPDPGAGADSRALPVGTLTAGRYHIDVKLLREEESVDGGRVPGGVARVSFDLPAGWTGFGESAHPPGWAILKGDADSPAGVAVTPSAVDLFYSDPCHSGLGAELHREWTMLTSFDEFSPAAMLDLNADRGVGRLWGTWADTTSVPPHEGFAPTSPTATKPSKGTVAGLDGWYMAARTPTDLDVTACDGGRYALWLDSGGGHYSVRGPGQLDRLWIVGVNGSDAQSRIQPLVIDGMSQAGASPADLAELQSIIDSLKIELLSGS